MPVATLRRLRSPPLRPRSRMPPGSVPPTWGGGWVVPGGARAARGLGRRAAAAPEGPGLCHPLRGPAREVRGWLQRQPAARRRQALPPSADRPPPLRRRALDDLSIAPSHQCVLCVRQPHCRQNLVDALPPLHRTPAARQLQRGVKLRRLTNSHGRQEVVGLAAACAAARRWAGRGGKRLSVNHTMPAIHQDQGEPPRRVFR
jgi:hypothetical protein